MDAIPIEVGRLEPNYMGPNGERLITITYKLWGKPFKIDFLNYDGNKMLNGFYFDEESVEADDDSFEERVKTALKKGEDEPNPDYPVYKVLKDDAWYIEE